MGSWLIRVRRREVNRIDTHEVEPRMGGLVLFENGLDLQIVEPCVGLLFPFGWIAGAEVGATELALLVVGQAGCPVKETVLLVGAAGAADLFFQTAVDVRWKASPFSFVTGVAPAEFLNGKGLGSSARPMC